MTHDEIKILISAYTDGEVTPSEKNIVEEHLKTCESCRKDLQTYKAMSFSLSSSPNETLSPDAAINVQKRFEQRREPMFTQRTTTLLTTTIALAIIIGSVVDLQVKHGIQGRFKSSTIVTSSQYWEKEKSMQPMKPAAAAPTAQYQPYYLASETKGRLKSATDDLGDQYSDTTSNSIILNTQQAYWGENAAPARLASTTSNFMNKSSRENVSYGMRMRTGAQVAVYASGYNPYYQPNYYWYYPQPYPVEPYRIQTADSNTEQYDRIYDNPFLAAKDNPLSTFSIDVDTGSYSNIRRFLTNGQKPPKDAVHIEELINYFSYDYPQPTGEDPFSITTEVSSCPWNPQHQLALIGLQGKKISTENLPASNLVFLVDVSGSMGEEDKLPLVKASLHLLVEQLRPQDTISIAVFAGSATNLLEGASGRDKDKIENAIDGLEAGGSTNGEDGLQMAYKIAKTNFIPHGNNRIIVTTDGDFNVGTSADGDLVRMIEEKRGQGIYLSVFGFGMGNLKADRMEKLADSGHGNYDYIDSLNEARKEFEQQLGGTLYAIAKDVKIQVEFNPATIKAYRLIGYEKRMLNKEDFNNDKKDAGVLGSGHTVTALYEITPAGSKEAVASVDELRYQTSTVNSSNDLMTIKLRYKDPESDTSKLITRTLNQSQVSESPSENLRFAGAVAEFGMLLRDSEYKGSSSYLQVMDSAQKAIGPDTNGYRKDFLDLIEKAGLLGHPSGSDDAAQ